MRFASYIGAIALCAAACLLASGCAHAPKPVAAPDPYSSMIDRISDMDADKIRERMASLKSSAANNPDSDEAVMARLELALLAADYRNLSPDYGLALAELEAIGKRDRLAPAVRREVMCWLNALRSIRDLQKSKESLQSEINSLKAKAAKDWAELQRLKQNLEKLQEIDLEIEEKRKKMK